MKSIQLVHWELTRTFMHNVGVYLQKSNIPIVLHRRNLENLGTFAAETLDDILRDNSKWLPTTKSQRGSLSLLRFIPELIPMVEKCANSLNKTIQADDTELSSEFEYDDFYCDIIEPYRQQLHDLVTSLDVDWAWAEWEITKFTPQIVTIKIAGDRRILEWVRSNKIKEVANARAIYAEVKSTIRYPSGFLRE